MSVRSLLSSLLFITLLLSQSAQAALQLELTQGVDDAVPIVVIPFTGQEGEIPADQNLAEIVSKDLGNSGRFQMVEPQIFKKGEYQGPVDFGYWRTMNADYVLKGEVKPLMFKRLQVTVQLFDVLGDQHEVFTQQFTINHNNMRQFAHHLSDIVYEKLTADKGVFSTRIAYVLVDRQEGKRTDYKLEIADADLHNPQVLFTSNQPIMSPAWSPDGKQLAFVSFEKRRAEIYVMNLKDGKRRMVSQAPGINGAPAWSPDGKQLALVLSKTGQPKIYSLDLKSGKTLQLTDGWSIDTEPAWAPDGKSILFTSGRGGGPQIYRVTLADKSVKRVTFKGNYNARASYTEDGKKIVMLHREEKMFHIAMQDLASGRISILTKTGLDESPSLSPNGKMVLYATHTEGTGVLGVVSTDGRVKLRLPARQGDVQEPAWSPYLG